MENQAESVRSRKYRAEILFLEKSDSTALVGLIFTVVIRDLTMTITSDMNIETGCCMRNTESGGQETQFMQRNSTVTEN